MNKLYRAVIPYYVIIILIPLLFFLFLNYSYEIDRYFTNKDNSEKVYYLELDMIRGFKENDYIDLRNSFKEDFNRIIVINLKYNLSDFSSKYGIDFSKLELNISEFVKAYLRDGTDEINEIDDFQLVMFFQDDRLIRYQELINNSKHYHFLVDKSKEYKDTYIFTTLSSSRELIPYNLEN